MSAGGAVYKVSKLQIDKNSVTRFVRYEYGYREFIQDLDGTLLNNNGGWAVP